ncbi:ATP-dependent DNA ligase [Rhodococcus triatomae BKS 15-14]|nr:ATP-dependent DNA ligase [Rhodococcus triatomae BKS 15-14]
MLATLGELPTGAGWAWELKWDGARAIVQLGGGTCRIVSRNGNDVTDSYPELIEPLLDSLAGRDAVLDGEIVAVDAGGRPSFGRLQRRMHVRKPTTALLREVPVTLYLFDVLALAGDGTTALPYRERRERLDSLDITGPRVQVPPSFTDVTGERMLDLAREHGLEGVVAKRVDSPYQPGRRSPTWIKHPLRANTEGVIVGWVDGSGAAAGGIGALLLGAYDDPDDDAKGVRALRYIGRVGTGYTATARRELRALLERIERRTSPLDIGPPAREARGAHWTTPRYVCDVEYREYVGGSLRHPAFKGLRTDKTPAEVDLPGRH